jgi:peptide chain release factor 3
MDRDEAPVYMARNFWDLGRIQEDWPDITFSATRERT